MDTPQDIDRIAKIVQKERARLRARLTAQETAPAEEAAPAAGKRARLADLFSAAFGQPSADADGRRL